MPTVSVIIPTYNRAHLIGRAIRSVLDQTYQDFELIVVDDGSTDNTQEVIKEFQQRNERIIYLKLEQNKGGSAARNTGIKGSKSEYIAFLDSDDEWLPEKLEKQIKLFISSSDNKVGIVGCGAFFIYSRENRNEHFKILPNKSGDIFDLLLAGKYYPAGGSIFLIKREVFKECGLFDESFELKIGGQQDYEMWIRIAKKYYFGQIKEYLVKYYFHSGDRITNAKIMDKAKSIEYLMIKHEDYYKNHPKIFSEKLRFLGSQFSRTENVKKGRKYFIKSMNYNKFNYNSYIYWLLSLFGPKFYNFIYKLVISYTFRNDNIVKKLLRKI